MKKLIIAVAFALAGATPTLAQDQHGDNSQLVSVPADDAVLATAPTSLSLTFEHTVILQSVEVHGAGHTNIPIAFTAPTTATAAYSIPLPALATGAYEVHWTANGDGHAMQGTFHFTVR